MKKDKKKRRKIIITTASLAVLLCLILLLLPYFTKKGTTLSIALYPYLPDQSRFEQAITTKWREIHPETELNFVPWNCYYDGPPEGLDVFVYDAVFFSDFLENGYLLPLEKKDIRDIDDYIPCAVSACQSDDVFYGVPQFLCTYLLYARKNDIEMNAVKNISELLQLVSNNPDSALPPAEGEGLLVDISSKMTLAEWYMEIQIDRDQNYTGWVYLPEKEALDPEIMNGLYELQETVGSDQMTYYSSEDDPFVKASWFVDGKCRAFIGYSEYMSAMGDAVKDVDFHTISFSDGDNIPMLYADFVSINAGISDEKKSLAIDLLNCITEKDTMVASISPSREDQYPQYLLGARNSIYDELSVNYPIYGRLKEIVSNPECRVFALRSSGTEIGKKAELIFELPIKDPGAE